MYVTLKNGKQLRMPDDGEDAEITAAALSDPDNPPLTDEELAQFRPAREMTSPELMTRLMDSSKPSVFHHVTDAGHAARRDATGKRGGRPPLAAPKQRIAIRLDADVLDGLRATGKGWQTRINAVLREAVEAGRV